MKKLISSAVGILLLVLPVAASADVASQIAQLQALIQQLMAQIAQLKAQQGGGTAFCHTFNTDLKFGDSVSERDGSGDTGYLHQALIKEGFTIDASDNNGRFVIKFGESTRAAVIKFQAKYGIKQTGYVGPLTRAQLNRLYGCKTAQANWKTYTNAEYGVKMDYPSDRFEVVSDTSYTDADVELELRDRDFPIVTLWISKSKDCSYYQNNNVYPFIKYVQLGSESFIQSNVSVDYSGMNSPQYVLGYCLQKNGITYELRDRSGGKDAVIQQVLQTFKLFPPTNASVSVPGMSKYTDSDFGFSFWYPSGWSVQENAGRFNVLSDAEGTTIKRLDVTTPTGQVYTQLYEFSSPSMSITVPYNGMGDGRLLNTFYFDPALHTWMAKPLPGSIGPLTPIAADVSNNTMGGLHIFSAAAGHQCWYTVVPLSAHNFVVGTECVPSDVGVLDYKLNLGFLINTIVATDPAVATPVSVAEQIKTIQAEKDAYVK